MKKYASLFFCALALSSSPLIAASASSSDSTGQKPSNKVVQQASPQTKAAPSDCSQMSADEQDFANQLMDMKNRSMFCSQFTAQQRQQAMQMMGQTDASGNVMNADQAVQQVMQMSPPTQMRPRSGGGCPVK